MLEWLIMKTIMTVVGVGMAVIAALLLTILALFLWSGFHVVRDIINHAR